MSQLSVTRKHRRRTAGVVLLPCLSGVGVISPCIPPVTLAGFRVRNTEHDLAFAAVEELAVAFSDCHLATPGEIDEIFTADGTSQSDLIHQPVADASHTVAHRVRSESTLVSSLSPSQVAATSKPTEIPKNLQRYRDLDEATRLLWGSWKESPDTTAFAPK